MSLAGGQSNPSLSSDEQHNVEVQDEIESVCALTKNTEQESEAQNVQIGQFSAREHVQTRALVLKNWSASIPAIGTEEISVANHQLMMPPVKPNCTETNLPFDSALRVRTNHPSMPPDRTSDTTLPSGENFEPLPASEKESMAHASQVGDGEKNGFVTGTTVTKEPAIATLMDNDCLESHEAGDFTTAVLADKGKRVDPREHGGTALNPNSTIVLADIDLSDIIKLIDAHRDKGKNVDPKERGDGAKYEPGPSRIDFPEYDSESAFQKQGIPLQSLEPTKTSDLNHEPLYESTPPRLSWHPKISPYRFIVFSIPLAVGTAKAISSQKGNVTVPITLEWISGVVVFLVLFLLGSYETRADIPKYLLVWLFKPDCVDLVWYLAAKLSIPRPEYLSNEVDLEFDPGHFVTSYRILVSAAVVFLGSLKTTFTYSNLSTDSIWMEWFLAAIVSSMLYLVGLYENNSLGLWSSFFRKDRSRFIHMDFGSAISLPSIVGLAFLLVVYSVQLIPAIKRNARKAFPEYIDDSQLPMGPTLSKGTLEEVYLVVVFYIPFAIIYVVFLILLMTQLWAPILASTSTLPSGIQSYTGRFFRAIERLAQRRPIDRIIYHSVAFVQLLLLVTWNVWIVLFLCFVDVTAEGETDLLLPTLSIKIVLYAAMVILSIFSFVIAAASGLGWWPARDRLTRLVPPSIANATVTRFIQRQLKALRRLGSSTPSDSSEGHLLLFIGFYLVLSIVVFAGCYALVNTSLLGSADLPLMVTVFILLVFAVWLWFYIGFKIFPDVFRDVLWRMRPLLHYGFQDFTESVRDSIESYNY